MKKPKSAPPKRIEISNVTINGTNPDVASLAAAAKANAEAILEIAKAISASHYGIYIEGDKK
jgi:hypothetical protein